METIDGGSLVGRVLREQGVRHLFAINGGHTFPILASLRDNGVKMIHMRHELPVHTVLWNNSSWGPSFEQMPLLKGRTDPFNILEGIRYDQMFAIMGCHVEHVEHPSDLVPALERAFSAGKASLINVLGDKRIGHPRLGGNLLGSTQL